MGEDPSLWTWSIVTVKSREDFHKLNLRRFQLVKELKIGDNCTFQEECNWIEDDWIEDDWIELFEKMANLPMLNMLNSVRCFWSRSNLSCVDTDLVLSVFRRLKKVFLYQQLSHEQVDQLFRAMAQNECSLNFLQICGDTTTELSPELFASAVSKVEEVRLYTCKITHEQLEALFVALVKDGGSRLEKLDLWACNTDGIEPALMGEAVNKLEVFKVTNTWVWRGQIRAILLIIANGESKLTDLMLGDLSYREFMDIAPQLVRIVRAKLGKFFYFDTGYMNADGHEYDPFQNEESFDLTESEDEGGSDEHDAN